MPRFMTARHLPSMAGHRAVPDCVKPAGDGGFYAIVFWEGGVCCQLRLCKLVGWIAVI